LRADPCLRALARRAFVPAHSHAGLCLPRLPLRLPWSCRTFSLPGL